MTEPAAVWDRKFYDSAAYEFPAAATHIMAYADGKYGRGGTLLQQPPPADLESHYSAHSLQPNPLPLITHSPGTFDPLCVAQPPLVARQISLRLPLIPAA